jgi:hypothetical protein
MGSSFHITVMSDGGEYNKKVSLRTRLDYIRIASGQSSRVMSKVVTPRGEM